MQKSKKQELEREEMINQLGGKKKLPSRSAPESTKKTPAEQKQIKNFFSVSSKEVNANANRKHQKTKVD